MLIDRSVDVPTHNSALPLPHIERKCWRAYIVSRDSLVLVITSNLPAYLPYLKLYTTLIVTDALWELFILIFAYTDASYAVKNEILTPESGSLYLTNFIYRAS